VTLVETTSTVDNIICAFENNVKIDRTINKHNFLIDFYI